MIRHPPRSKRADSLLPDTSLFRSAAVTGVAGVAGWAGSDGAASDAGATSASSSACASALALKTVFMRDGSGEGNPRIGLSAHGWDMTGERKSGVEGKKASIREEHGGGARH